MDDYRKWFKTIKQSDVEPGPSLDQVTGKSKLGVKRFQDVPKGIMQSKSTAGDHNDDQYDSDDQDIQERNGRDYIHHNTKRQKVYDPHDTVSESSAGSYMIPFEPAE